VVNNTELLQMVTVNSMAPMSNTDYFIWCFSLVTRYLQKNKQ